MHGKLIDPDAPGEVSGKAAENFGLPFTRHRDPAIVTDLCL